MVLWRSILIKKQKKTASGLIHKTKGAFQLQLLSSLFLKPLEAMNKCKVGSSKHYQSLLLKSGYLTNTCQRLNSLEDLLTTSLSINVPQISYRARDAKSLTIQLNPRQVQTAPITATSQLTLHSIGTTKIFEF